MAAHYVADMSKDSADGLQSGEQRYLTETRAHDYAFAIRRWRSLAKESGLTMRVIAERGGYRIYGLRTRKLSNAHAPLYLSAGCHGDEPAAVQGLLEWAEENTELLRARNVIIFPCLNPWGLVHNTRHDHEGNDLNRLFHDLNHPLIEGWRRFIDGLSFPLAATLHEDYDANGIYLYELNPRVGHSYGEPLLQQCEKILPRERGGTIEGRKAVRAIVRRTRGVPKLEGMPEAVTLFAEQRGATLTFETPSEYSIYRRVLAHKAFVAGVFEFALDG